jgi:hypothetical protein
MEKYMKHYFITTLLFLTLLGSAQAKAPFIEHGNGFFEEQITLKACLSQGAKVFNNLGITLKKSTNPKNEVVGFQGNYKLVLYCISDEGGCDEPEDEYASAGTVIVAGTEYARTARFVKDIIAGMKMQQN